MQEGMKACLELQHNYQHAHLVTSTMEVKTPTCQSRVKNPALLDA